MRCLRCILFRAVQKLNILRENFQRRACASIVGGVCADANAANHTHLASLGKVLLARFRLLIPDGYAEEVCFRLFSRFRAAIDGNREVGDALAALRRAQLNVARQIPDDC